MNDKLRLGVMLVVSNILTVLLLFHFVDWTPDQIGAVNGLVDSILLLVMYFFPKGQGIR